LVAVQNNSEVKQNGNSYKKLYGTAHREKNGQHWPSYTFKAQDVLIENGKIVEIRGWENDKCKETESQKHKVIDGEEHHVLLPAFVDNHIHSRLVGYFGPGLPDPPVGYASCKEKLDEAYFEAANSGAAILMDYPEYPFNKKPEQDGFHLPK